jgi:toxin ParE1/3/4
VATRFLEAIEARLHKLRFAPAIGSKRDIFAPDLRALPHGAYVIYYTATPTHLVIVRVLHGARDVQAIGERGGFEAG